MAGMTWKIEEFIRFRELNHKCAMNHCMMGDEIADLLRLEKIYRPIDNVEVLLGMIAKAKTALRFYAERNHFEWQGDEDFAPENPSGEPSNLECGGSDGNEFTLENGGTARIALAQIESGEL